MARHVDPTELARVLIEQHRAVAARMRAEHPDTPPGHIDLQEQLFERCVLPAAVIVAEQLNAGRDPGDIADGLGVAVGSIMAQFVTATGSLEAFQLLQLRIGLTLTAMLGGGRREGTSEVIDVKVPVEEGGHA